MLSLGEGGGLELRMTCHDVTDITREERRYTLYEYAYL